MVDQRETKMEPAQSPLTGLNKDILTNIMERLDGLSLVAVASTCSQARDAARDQDLWRQLCHSLWPSTALQETASLIGDFQKFYSESYPLIHDEIAPEEIARARKHLEAEGSILPGDLVSMVDIYYKNKCILSKAVVGNSEEFGEFGNDNEKGCQRNMISESSKNCFSNLQFYQSILNLNYNDDIRVGEADFNQMEDNDANIIFDEPLPTASNTEARNWRVLGKELESELRLSWVLLDKNKGRAINLSSWRPISLQRIWPFNGEYRVYYGSIISVEERVLPHRLAKCTILVNCRQMEGDRLELKEVSLHVEDLMGKHLNVRTSLMILNRALYCSRTTEQHKVKQVLSYYERHKKDIMRQRDMTESLITGLFVLIEVIIILLLFHVLRC